MDETTVTGLVVNADVLKEGPESVLLFLRHEAAHMLCWRRDVKDTTMNGAYHNQSFLAAAEEVGLVWPEGKERVQGRGYAGVELSDDVLRAHAVDLEALADAIPQSLPHLTLPATSAPRRMSRLTMHCQCEPTPRKIYVSKTIAALGPITCGVCGAEFTA